MMEAKTMPADAAEAQQEAPIVLREDKPEIAILTLNRPRQYNALSVGLMADLIAELEGIAADPCIKAVILQGTGKGFCAGHDLKEMRTARQLGDGKAFFQETFELCSRLMLTLTRLPQPVIAKVHGIATAAGCQLVATCDLAVADETAHFGTPGVNIGLFCSTPMVALSRAVPRKVAMKMLLTGEMLDAAQAVAFGLINEAVPAEKLDTAALDLAETIRGKSGHVVKIGKEAFYKQIELDLEAAYAHTSEVMTLNMLARDAEEGIDAFIEKRSPVWQEG